MLSKKVSWIRWLVLLLPCAVAASVGACSAEGSGVGGGGISENSGGGSAEGTGGLSIDTDGGPIGTGGGTGSGDEAWPDWLSPPWVMYTTNTDGVDSWKDPNLPDNVDQLYFGAPGAGSAPEIIYPLNGSLHPRNLTDIEMQWSKAVNTNTYARVEAVAQDGAMYRFYFSCTTPGCAVEMPASEWYYLGMTHAGQSMTLTVQETDGAGGPVYTSAPITISFSPAPLLGVLYYWAAASWAINRAQFGSRGSVEFIGPGTPENSFRCAACHSVSRDGSTIAFAVSQDDGEGTAAIQVAPTSAPDQPYLRPAGPGATPYTGAGVTHNGSVTEGPLDNFGHNVALSPDGTVAAINGAEAPEGWPAWFELRDTRTGVALQKFSIQNDPASPFPDGSLPILPEFSPDGTKLAATVTQMANNCAWSYATCSPTGIVVMDVINNTVGAPVQLTVPQPGATHYYPTWSPAGDYIVFVSATGLTASDKNDETDIGVLYMVPSTGGPHTCPGPTCVELARGGQFTQAQADASGGVGPHVTVPKFAPFAQGPTGNIVFVSFSTRIEYGWRIPGGGRSQLWMFGIDLTRPGDPSFEPIWLPYQEYADGSLAAFWAEIAPCTTDGGCSCRPGEECRFNQNNECYCTFTNPE